MWIFPNIPRMKRLTATILAVLFLLPACEDVWAIPFDHQVSHAIQTSPTSEMIANDSDGPDHFVCGNHTPKSPCDNSEPQHFEIAPPSSESTKSSDKGHPCKPIVFSSDFQRLSVDRETKTFNTPILRVG